jgi:glycerol-3-phosphate cytidylyltransferase
MIRGIIFGAFDLLHPGHLFTLRECRRRCDYLTIGLQVDPSNERKDKNKPIETIFERYMQLKSCKFVDAIVPYETEQDVLNMLATLNIDIRFNGEDHANKEFPSVRDELCGKLGIEIKYIARNHSWSSTELRNRIK